MKNYYEILQVSHNASPEIIEKAYRTLSKQYHPDLQPRDKLYWAECQFKELKEAYDVLSNPLTRKNYDIALTNFYHSQINYAPITNTNVSSQEQSVSNQQSLPKKKKNKPPSNKQKIDGLVEASVVGLKDLIHDIPAAFKKHRSKPKEERSKDIKALFLSLLIVSIIVFIFLKVPFLKKLVFP